MVSVNNSDSDKRTSSSVRYAMLLQSSILASNTSMLWLLARENRICHFRTTWPMSRFEEFHRKDCESLVGNELPGQ